jgi:hypothetical protein
MINFYQSIKIGHIIVKKNKIRSNPGLILFTYSYSIMISES